jgi:hypothetical protein
MRLLVWIFTLAMTSLNASALEKMPKEIKRAFTGVHQAAATTSVKNLFMFNYTYFAGQFCKDQDCSVDNVAKQIDGAKAKLGDDLEKYSLHQAAYEKAIKRLQSDLPKGDLATLSGSRTADQVLKFKIFMTCVDFAKAVLLKALENGFAEADLKFYVLMNLDGYRKMCPGKADGNKPVAPRPVIHSLVAYRTNGNWFTLNVEDPEAVPSLVGPDLPDRLGRDYQFTFPALIAYQPMTYAGAFEPKDFVNGYDFGWLLGITAAGKLEKDPAKIVCE